jgi:hypothetical protein
MMTYYLYLYGLTILFAYITTYCFYVLFPSTSSASYFLLFAHNGIATWASVNSVLEGINATWDEAGTNAPSGIRKNCNNNNI